MRWDWINASWKARLGNGGLLVGFFGLETFHLLHSGFNEWADKVDAEVFHAANRWYPTSTFIAVGAAFVLGAIGWVIGLIVDRAVE